MTPDLPPALRDRSRDAHNALVSAVTDCFGPDSPLIQELGGLDYSLPSDMEPNAWYEDFLDSERK